MGLDLIYHFLKNEQIKVGRGRIHRLMKKYNIHSCRYKSFKCTTNSNHSKPIAPNLLHQYFEAPAPNVAWVGDITYIPTHGSTLQSSKTSVPRRLSVTLFLIE